jgi:FKBP-type peptidyl-prolyl cis-trans isomerase FkpA
MKKYILILSILTLGLASCLKDDTQTIPPPTVDPVKQAQIDDNAIKAYLASHPSIHATKDENGFYYEIQTEGTGSLITTSSIVTVSYVGTNIKDQSFDSSTNFTTGLSDQVNIIKGWKLGLQKAKKGSKILLILPSALAYGPNGNGPITPNEVILFTITVKDVK